MRVKRFLSDLLLVTGVLLILDAGLAVAWEEPVSAVYTSWTQGRLSDELDELESAERSGEQGRAGAEGRGGAPERGVIDARRQAAALNRRLGPGEPVGRLKIPAIGLDYVMVQGTDEASIRKGPAHYTETSLPGGTGTVGIAGHRTTYQAPFRRINKLQTGDSVELQMPYGTFTYTVRGSRIVSPTATDVFRRRGTEGVTLTACHPLYSDAERFIVFAARTQPELASEPPQDAGHSSESFATDESFGVPIAVSLLIGLPGGLVGAAASVAGLQRAPVRQRGGLVATLACSLVELAGFALVFLGVIG